MSTQHSDFGFLWAEIIADAWRDPEFFKAVQEDPKKVLISRKCPIPIPPDIDIVIDNSGLPNTPTTIRLPLPPKPEDVDVGTGGPPPPHHGGSTACCSSLVSSSSCCCP